MSRSPMFLRLVSDFRLANECASRGVSTPEGLERRAEAYAALRRRDFVVGMAGVAATAALPRRALAARASDLDVGIVGGGLAGLVCANELKRGRHLVRFCALSW